MNAERPTLPPQEQREQQRWELLGSAASSASPDHPDRNEDHSYFDSESGIIGVFDGLGGVAGGHIASLAAMQQLTKKNLHYYTEQAKNFDEKTQKHAEFVERVFTTPIDQPQNEEDIRKAGLTLLERMHQSILSVIQQPDVIQHYGESLKHCGTTASFCKVWTDETGNKKVTSFQLGDSTLYRVRNGHVLRLVSEDSYNQYLFDTRFFEETLPENQDPLIQERTLTQLAEHIKHLDDERAPTRLRLQLRVLYRYLVQHDFTSFRPLDIRHFVTQHVNADHFYKKTPNVTTHNLEDGDILVACTDGVSDNLSPSLIAHQLEQNENPFYRAEAVRRAASLASRQEHYYSKPDDISVIVLELKNPQSKHQVEGVENT